MKVVYGPENSLADFIRTKFEKDQISYNPILIYGPKGCGKTSLLNTLVAAKQQSVDLKKTISITGKDFCRSLKSAIESRSTADFRNLFLGCRLFAFDGLDELSRSEAAQQELTTVLDRLTTRNCSIIITSEHIPNSTRGLSSGLCSRCVAGLSIPLSPPTQNTRRTILELLCQSRNIQISYETLSTLARMTDGPEPRYFLDVEKLVEQLKILSDLPQSCVAEEQIKKLLEDGLLSGGLLTEKGRTSYTLRTLTSAVAKFYRVRVSDLTGTSRCKKLAEARGIAVYLCRLLTAQSLSAIGKFFGGRDHTTILHAVRKSAQLIADEPSTRSTVDEIRGHLGKKLIANRFSNKKLPANKLSANKLSAKQSSGARTSKFKTSH